MALSRIALASRALLKLGAGTIASFDEGTAEAEIAGNLYPSLRDALLSAHPWSFATAQATLPKLAAEPVADFAFAYQLPSDFLRALSAGPGGRGRGIDYRIAERRLHANADVVVLTYVFRPDEVDFPPFFDQALIAGWARDAGLIRQGAEKAELELLRRRESIWRESDEIDSRPLPDRDRDVLDRL